MASRQSRPLTEECPICFAQVSSMELLSCSHKMCSECLDRILSSSSTSFCPCCRKDIETDGRRRIYVGKIECFLCLKSKDSEEFIWCCDCNKLICCRCQLLEHSKAQASHQIFEWNTKEAIDNCVSIFESVILDEKLLEQQIAGLLKPVIGLVKQRVVENANLRNDVVKELGASFRAIPNAQNKFMEPENCQKVAEALAKLSGLEIPIDDIRAKYLPYGLSGVREIVDVICKGLEFGAKSDKFEPKVKNQSTETDGELLRINVVAGKATSSLPETTYKKSAKSTDFMLYPSNISAKILMLRDAKNKNTTIYSFGNSASKVVFGPLTSIGIIDGHQCLTVDDWMQSNTTKIVLAAAAKETLIMDMAMFDSEAKAYFLLANGNTWQLVHYNYCKQQQYSVNISKKLPNDCVPVSGLICCTITGVPYAAISCTCNQSDGLRFKSFLFQFSHGNTSHEYKNVTTFYTLENQKTTSMTALRRSQYDYRILVGTCENVYLFTYSGYGLNYAKSFPIHGVSLLLSTWKNDFKFSAVYGLENMLETYTINNTEPVFVRKFELKDLASYSALKYWKVSGKETLSTCKYIDGVFVIGWNSF